MSFRSLFYKQLLVILTSFLSFIVALQVEIFFKVLHYISSKKKKRTILIMPFFLYEILFVCTDNSLEQWSHKCTNYLNVKCIYGDYGHNTLQFNSFPCKITSWLRKQNAEGLIHPSILFNFPNLQFKFYTKKVMNLQTEGIWCHPLLPPLLKDSHCNNQLELFLEQA